MFYARNTYVVRAARWFKNGDHPKDGPPDKEGRIVRYYRHPDIPGDMHCVTCGDACEHKQKQSLHKIIEEALANGYLPAAMPTEEFRYSKFMFPAVDTTEDSEWDIVLVKLTLPLRRAYLDTQYILQPKKGNT